MTELTAPLKMIVEPVFEVKLPALLKLPDRARPPPAFIMTDPDETIFKSVQTSPAELTVMVIPACTITMSLATGGTPSDQFNPFSHAPEERAILLALEILELKTKNSMDI